jgi:23S rRNA (guanosine2251-2'-O)-methyltransferase
MNVIVKNPHSVLLALAKRPGDVRSVQISGGAGEVWEEVATQARKAGIQVQGGGGGSRPHGGRGREAANDGRVGGAQATIAEKPESDLSEIFPKGDIDPNRPAVWLALDCIQDPHNVGAIFRTAAFFGVKGILLTQERSAPMTGTVYDVACGGVESVPFSVQVNLQRTFEVAKEAGVWILGSSEHAKLPLAKVPVDRPWLLVLGSEEKGMRRLTEELCDMVCSVPAKGAVTSLNVSVAAGILVSALTPQKT